MKPAHDKIAVGLEDAIASTKAPVLTRAEMARLKVIQHFEGTRSATTCDQKPKTTASLIAKGLVEARGGEISKTGRILRHADAILTAAGRAVLAGLPGEDRS